MHAVTRHGCQAAKRHEVRSNTGCEWYGMADEWYGMADEWYGMADEWYGMPDEWYGMPDEWYGMPNVSRRARHATNARSFSLT